jgi:hypothetical protein
MKEGYSGEASRQARTVHDKKAIRMIGTGTVYGTAIDRHIGLDLRQLERPLLSEGYAQPEVSGVLRRRVSDD